MADYTNQILTISELHSPVKDTETSIVVNTATRDFTFGTKFNHVIGVVGDHNSNEVTFQLPRHIDSHDISQCSKHVVCWANPKAGTSGEFKDVTVTVSEEDDTVKLGWLISGEVTENVGEITFGLVIEDYNAEDKLEYRWQTQQGEGLQVIYGFKKVVKPEDDYVETPENVIALVDQITGKSYNLYVSNGKLMMAESGV